MAEKEITPETLEMLPRISIPQIVRNRVVVPIVGITPLIVHRFSEKARKQILEDQHKRRVKAVREPQDPEAEYNASRYIVDEAQDVDGFPASGFKAAIAGAARMYGGAVTMTSLKVGVFVEGEGSEQLVRLDNAKRRMREDAAKVGMGQVNLRFRAEYDPWAATLSILYVPTLVDSDSVIALVDVAGMGGVGEWRPSAPKSLTGTFGQFQVDRTRDIVIEDHGA